MDEVASLAPWSFKTTRWTLLSLPFRHSLVPSTRPWTFISICVQLFKGRDGSNVTTIRTWDGRRVRCLESQVVGRMWKDEGFGLTLAEAEVENMEGELGEEIGAGTDGGECET